MSMARSKGAESVANNSSTKEPDYLPRVLPKEAPSKYRNHVYDATDKPIAMSVTQETPRFEMPKQFGVTNNNDQSYLHKKFKKKASILSTTENKLSEAQRQSDLKQVNHNTNILESQKVNQVIFDVNVDKQLEGNRRTEGIERLNDRDAYLKPSNNYNNVQTTNPNSDVIYYKIDKTDINEFETTRESTIGNGRYVCKYCNLSCAKPSVLEKHIRAHTNERPYPCVPCGFAFKTKSNLYKHSRTRVHKLRTNGLDSNGVVNDSDWMQESESESGMTTEPMIEESSISNLRSSATCSPVSVDDKSLNSQYFQSSCQLSETCKSKTIYKPKFHRAYKEEEDKQKKQYPPNADFLNEHISKIISDNEAIVDVLETPLQKKYGKIKQMAENKQYESMESKISESKNDLSPLNLTKSNENDSGNRKRCYSETFTQAEILNNPQHPLNPERSIIKDLLLKTKALANGLLPVTSESYDGTEPLFVCSLCQISYRNAENLEIHSAYYCKAKQLQKENGLKISPVQNFRSKNTIKTEINSNFMGDVMSNRTSSSPKKLLYYSPVPTRCKPESLTISKPAENADVSTPLPSPGPLLGNTRLVDERRDSRASTESPTNRPTSNSIKPILSPKRKLDFRPDSYTVRISEDSYSRPDIYRTHNKIRRIESPTTRYMDEMSTQGLKQNSSSLQMFGGEVKIIDNSGGTTTLRIEPTRAQNSHILVPLGTIPANQRVECESSSIIRSGLQSGGTIVQNVPIPKEAATPPHTETLNLKFSITPNISAPNIVMPHSHSSNLSRFPFPPLGAITAYNPLTLPPLSQPVSPNGSTKILHGGKLIPHVPGIPGPNTTALNLGFKVKQQSIDLTGPSDRFCEVQKSQNESGSVRSKLLNPNEIFKQISPKINTKNVSKDELDLKTHRVIETKTSLGIKPIIKINNIENYKIFNGNNSRHHDDATCMNSTQEKKEEITKLKSANFNSKSGNSTQYNFETMIAKAKIVNTSKIETKLTDFENNSSNFSPQERSEPAYFQKNNSIKVSKDDGKGKFLRPSSLPLKPGTFTPKKHHGITPNANTMPLISPETPRPAKAYGQLYLNGNAYTYLGLKCSTKSYYCTLNRPQPTYVPNQQSLSMYSNWQICSELTPHALGLSASEAMGLYDSRHRPSNFSISKILTECHTTHSSQWMKTKEVIVQKTSPMDKKSDQKQGASNNEASSRGRELTGGFESNEEYTYIRGRGRGKYVCSECGIRCKKPSMLKKHIRTHTDVRPYTCKHCDFSFKTKGNLTKHMKSKAHYKKCRELGVNPFEGSNEMDVGDQTPVGAGDSDEETESDPDDVNEAETESSDTDSWKSRLPEHEAAHCLLSLWGSRSETSTSSSLTSARPCTYPYAPTCKEEQKAITMGILKTETSCENSEPMDLSKTEIKSANISPPREYTVIASLASNTAKLPQQPSEWTNGEPMLNAYLTEKALKDSKIKQSQLIVGLDKAKKETVNISSSSESMQMTSSSVSTVSITFSMSGSHASTVTKVEPTAPSAGAAKQKAVSGIETLADVAASTAKIVPTDFQKLCDVNTSTENAKFVASEYLKMARGKQNEISVDENLEDDKQSSLKDVKNSNNFETTDKEQSKNQSDSIASKVVVGAGGVTYKVTAKGGDFSSGAYTPGRLTDDGRSVCNVCNKTFSKQSQLRLHINIHYMERPFRCGACAVSFRTKGHLQKHERSGAHLNKVSMTSTFGAATTSNPRPFRCSDCNIAFRIHGHLAKHLRSKMHVMRLECSGKLPFGTFAEIERAGVSLTDIDTTDCANSLVSLQLLAQKLHEKDPTKLEAWDPSTMVPPLLPAGKESSDEEDNADIKPEQCPIIINERSLSQNDDVDTRVVYSATDT